MAKGVRVSPRTVAVALALRPLQREQMQIDFVKKWLEIGKVTLSIAVCSGSFRTSR